MLICVAEKVPEKQVRIVIWWQSSVEAPERHLSGVWASFPLSKQRPDCTSRAPLCFSWCTTGMQRIAIALFIAPSELQEV